MCIAAATTIVGCARSESPAASPLASSNGAAISSAAPISGATPFPVTCATEGGFEWNTEIEPHMAVNPSNRDNIVVAWQQDAYPDARGARGIVSAATFDGGRTWERRIVPGLTECSGGTFGRAMNPWLAFTADGSLYLASIAFTPLDMATSSTLAVGPGVESAVAVSRSTDGGITWSAPDFVSRLPATGLVAEARPTIVAHHSDPEQVYLIWTRHDGRNYTTYFVRSQDSGSTWSERLPIAATAALNVPDADIASLRWGDSDLLLEVVAVDTNRFVFPYSAFASSDNGVTWWWQGYLGNGRWLTGGPMTHYRAAPRLAIGESHTAAYVARASIDSGQIYAIRLLPDVVVSGPVDADAKTPFLPAIAVAEDDVVAILFYDTRNHVPDDDPDRTDIVLTTDVWLAASRDHGVTWSTRHVAGSFITLGGADFVQHAAEVAGIEAAPLQLGPPLRFFMGRYVGIVGLEHEFGVAFVGTGALAQTGPSDIIFARVAPP